MEVHVSRPGAQPTDARIERRDGVPGGPERPGRRHRGGDRALRVAACRRLLRGKHERIAVHDECERIVPGGERPGIGRNRIAVTDPVEGNLDLAETVADQVWREGCRDPAVAVIHIQTVAAPGRVADLTVAVADCRDALALRRGSTDRAWEHLALLLSNLHGRLARAQVPPATRHTAQNPARPPRTPRFRRRCVVGV